MSFIYISQQNRGKTNWNRCKIVAVEVWREGQGGGAGGRGRGQGQAEEIGCL